MKTAKPVHPGSLMRTALEREGWTITAAAARLGVARPNLHRVLTGRTALSPLMAAKFARLTGADAALLLGMQVRLELWRVEQRYPPRVDRKQDDFSTPSDPKNHVRYVDGFAAAVRRSGDDEKT
jgi:addiction module HigA family antidote